MPPVRCSRNSPDIWVSQNTSPAWQQKQGQTSVSSRACSSRLTNDTRHSARPALGSCHAICSMQYRSLPGHSPLPPSPFHLTPPSGACPEPRNPKPALKTFGGGMIPPLSKSVHERGVTLPMLLYYIQRSSTQVSYRGLETRSPRSPGEDLEVWAVQLLGTSQWGFGSGPLSRKESMVGSQAGPLSILFP